MRQILAVLGLGVLALASGCANSKWGLFRSSQTAERLPATNPTAPDLVNYLNRNAQRIQSLECAHVDLDVKQGMQPFHVDARIACQKPRNFRMHATALGKTEADIGSNDQEFWYWIARGDPYLIHCSYQDLASGARTPFPFQPEWIIEALGMAEFDPNQKYEAVPKGNSLELVQSSTNSRGERIQKVTVFSNVISAPVRVTDHILRNAKGEEICRAKILEVQEVAKGIVIPRKVVLSYPGEKLEMRMTLWTRLDDVRLNTQIDAEQAKALFTRPTLSGVQSYDLARGPDGGNALRPAGAFAPR